MEQPITTKNVGQPCVICGQAADAQATIAALQARVNGLEKDSELLRQSRDDFRVKYESVKNDAITLQAQLTQRTAECAALKLVNDMHMKTVMKLSHVVEQRTAEFQRHDGELQQICGQALGYPWFKDDQKNFPGATEKGGVCVGEHVGITIAQELANAYRKRTAELEAAKAIQAIDLKNNNAYREQVANLQAELERVSLLSSHNERRFEMLDKKYKELRTLLLALPKVEGEINERFCTGSYYSSPHDYRSHVTFETALVALLKHRQGME